MKTLRTRLGAALFRLGVSLTRSRLRRELLLIDEDRLIARTGMNRRMLIDRVGIRPRVRPKGPGAMSLARFTGRVAGNDGLSMELRQAA